MDWGLQPCWCLSTLANGVHFVRRFPSLEVIALVVKFAETQMIGMSLSQIAKLENKQLRIIAAMVIAEFKLEADKDPTWRSPAVQVLWEGSTR